MPEPLSLLQHALDRARALGQPISPPVIRRTDAPVQLDGASFDDLLSQAAAREGIDASLLKAVATAESGLDADAVSSAGAKGVMQLMDSTARSVGVRDSFDPAQSIAGGAKYLKQMLTRYGGDVQRALAAYNAGPGAVDAFGGVPPYAETQSYVQNVLRLARTR
ncbi:MAG TPA: lytic transglycosylase domain-containing protein [Chloroflexota bacterium]|nr:lytic transglycosylase domain-containing protein [Chloroflexota bacterium]